MRAVILDLKAMETLDVTAIQSQVTELVCYEITPAEQIEARVKGFDIVITNKTPLIRDVIKGAEALKLICVLATGTNVVDKVTAAEYDIPVCNCVAYGVDSVVQHVWALILALHTNLVSYEKDVRNGRWAASQQFCFLDHPVVELKGRTLGIIGYGNLGQGVAAIAKAFGMNLLVAQRPGTDTCEPDRVPMSKLIEDADVISLHCPLTEETENLFTLDTFRRMKSGSFLINAARGGIVNEQDLATALRQGLIAGAATDVLTEEPPKAGNPLLQDDIPNLIVTPHMAWGSEQARKRIIQQTAENIAAFRQGSPIRQV